MGFDNIKKTRKMVISLEFDNAYNVAELTRLYNPCEKKRLIREVNKKPQRRETRIRAYIYVDVFKIYLRGIKKEEYSIFYTNNTSRAYKFYVIEHKSEAQITTKYMAKYVEV